MEWVLHTLIYFHFFSFCLSDGFWNSLFPFPPPPPRPPSLPPSFQLQTDLEPSSLCPWISSPNEDSHLSARASRHVRLNPAASTPPGHSPYGDFCVRFFPFIYLRANVSSQLLLEDCGKTPGNCFVPMRPVWPETALEGPRESREAGKGTSAVWRGTYMSPVSHHRGTEHFISSVSLCVCFLFFFKKHLKIVILH